MKFKEGTAAPGRQAAGSVTGDELVDPPDHAVGEGALNDVASLAEHLPSSSNVRPSR